MKVYDLIAALQGMPQDARIATLDPYFGVVRLLEGNAQVVTSLPSPDDADKSLVVVIG